MTINNLSVNANNSTYIIYYNTNTKLVYIKKRDLNTGDEYECSIMDHFQPGISLYDILYGYHCSNNNNYYEMSRELYHITEYTSNNNVIIDIYDNKLKKSLIKIILTKIIKKQQLILTSAQGIRNDSINNDLHYRIIIKNLTEKITNLENQIKAYENMFQ